MRDARGGDQAAALNVPALLLSLFAQGLPADCLATVGRCFDLVPAPSFRSAVQGAAHLVRIPSPFGVAVTREGHHLHELVLVLEGLPEPAKAGGRAFVAWVTTPLLEPMIQVGVVRNGENRIGPVALHRFLVLVSAEPSGDVETRSGPLVLRGASPGNLLLPLDAADLPGVAVAPQSHDHGAGAWRAPPMHPAVRAMPPGLEHLRPSASPYLPDTAGAPSARPGEVIALADGDSLVLEAGVVKRNVAGRSIVAYAFNGQYPGPLIRVTAGARVVIRFTNRLDQRSSIHWHGVRLDNGFDGVPDITQQPVPPGGAFRYVVRFPDAGLFWYHPHQREDIQQDLGLYGNLYVQQAAEEPVRRNSEQFLLLDDLLLGPSGQVPYGREHATHALMGRFGNVLLVNGEPDYRLRVNRNAVVRFFLTNAANTRTFNLSLDGADAELKVVGSDMGLFEREELVQSVPIGAAERYIVDARFPRAGTVALVNRVQALDRVAGTFFTDTDTLGLITVEPAPSDPDYSPSFMPLRRRPEITAELGAVVERAPRVPTHELMLTLTVHGLPFGLVQALRLDTAFVAPVEWSGTMPMMDWLSTARDVRWILRDLASGRENMDVDWRFRVGEVARIRFTNDRHTLHPMAHPIHIHGQRFVVLAVDRVPNTNLVWKDTFLLPAGSTADILLELSNPGRWMLHCHIAEHLEAGMHTVFTVE